jgi:ribonuclease I
MSPIAVSNSFLVAGATSQLTYRAAADEVFRERGLLRHNWQKHSQCTGRWAG